MDRRELLKKAALAAPAVVAGVATAGGASLALERQTAGARLTYTPSPDDPDYHIPKSTNTCREWDEPWTAPDGKVLNLHQVEMTLDFNTGFIFDWDTEKEGVPDFKAPGQTIRVAVRKRRSMLGHASLQDLHETYPVPGDSDAKVIGEYILATYETIQRNGWDVAKPKDCVHGLHIRVTMPNRDTGKMEVRHTAAWLPVPLKVKDLLFFGTPASRIFS